MEGQSLKIELEAAKSKFKAMDDEIASIHGGLQTVQNKIEALAEKIDPNEQLEADLKVYKSKIESLEQELTLERSHAEHLSQVLESVKEAYLQKTKAYDLKETNLLDRIIWAKVRIDVAKEELENKDSEVKLLQEKVDSYSNEQAALLEKLNNLEEVTKQMKNALHTN